MEPLENSTFQETISQGWVFLAVTIAKNLLWLRERASVIFNPLGGYLSRFSNKQNNQTTTPTTLHTNHNLKNPTLPLRKRVRTIITTTTNNNNYVIISLFDFT